MGSHRSAGKILLALAIAGLFAGAGWLSSGGCGGGGGMTGGRQQLSMTSH